MANAEDLTLQLSEAASQRHIELIEDDFSQFVGIMALRNQHSSERAAELVGVKAHDLESPSPHSSTRRFAVTRVAREDIAQTFFLQHLKSLLQPEQQVRGRSERKVALF